MGWAGERRERKNNNCSYKMLIINSLNVISAFFFLLKTSIYLLLLEKMTIQRCYDCLTKKNFFSNLFALTLFNFETVQIHFCFHIYVFFFFICLFVFPNYLFLFAKKVAMSFLKIFCLYMLICIYRWRNGLITTAAGCCRWTMKA